jgi:hypothetical protein
MARDRPARSRRCFLRSGLAVAGLDVLAGCGVPFGPAAPPARLHRIGFLSGNSATSSGSLANLAAFRQGLRELGYVEGRFARQIEQSGQHREVARKNVDIVGHDRHTHRLMAAGMVPSGHSVARMPPDDAWHVLWHTLNR